MDPLLSVPHEKKKLVNFRVIVIGVHIYFYLVDLFLFLGIFPYLISSLIFVCIIRFFTLSCSSMNVIRKLFHYYSVKNRYSYCVFYIPKIFELIQAWFSDCVRQSYLIIG